MKQKQNIFQKVPILFLLTGVMGLTACQSHKAQTPEQQHIDTLADNVKAVEQEEQMEQTGGDLYDQSTLANPDPAQD